MSAVCEPTLIMIVLMVVIVVVIFWIDLQSEYSEH